MPYYLEDMQNDDIQQLTDLMKQAKKCSFPDPVSASWFRRACLNEALVRLGVEKPNSLVPTQINQIKKKLGIKVQLRENYQGDDDWRNGIYVYKEGNGPDKDNMVAFISNIRTDKSPIVIKPDFIVWAAVDVGQRRIFS